MFKKGSWRVVLTNVYIDGFNLYYRALKDTRFKWLDLFKLSQRLFPHDQINHVCYFTALIKPRANDPNQPQRQQTYLRACNTLPNFHIFYGTYRDRTKTRPLANPTQGMPKFATVKDSEEKGSDVNLVTRLLVDGFRGLYDQAAVVSNDSHLAGAISAVRKDIRLPVVIVNPDLRNHTALNLQNAATRIKRLRQSHLGTSQFPSTIRDGRGTITKPSSW